MALTPWTIELLRRGISDVARKASEPQTLAKIKDQASEILQDLPDTAARGIDAVIRSAEAGKDSVGRWARKHTALAIPLVNASGVLFSPRGTGVPLAEPVLSVGREFMAGDVVGGEAVAERLGRRLSKQLPAGGNNAIAITSSFSAALTALSLLVGETELVIHRNHAVRLPDGRPLPEAFSMLVPVIREVGAVGHVSQHDFDDLDRFCAIIADTGTRPVELLDLGKRDFMQAVVLPLGTVTSSKDESIPSAEAMLTRGADFVVLPADGLLGGPPAGIIIGRGEEIAHIRSSSVWPALAANDAVEAMTIVALELASEQSDRSPLVALLQTSEENLRDRAERMATRLGGSDSIAACRITAEDARLTSEGRWHFPSRQLRLRHANLTAGQWSERLQNELPSVLAPSDNNELKVDLRWIAAADDGKLAESLGG